MKLHLRRLGGFGWLLYKADKPALNAAATAYGTVLKEWVTGFRDIAAKEVESKLIEQLVGLISARANQASAKGKLKDMNIENVVKEGISKLRIANPSQLVFKEILGSHARRRVPRCLAEGVSRRRSEEVIEEFTAARER